MKINKSIYALILSTCLTNLVASDLPQELQFFDTNNRSEKLIAAISSAFNKVSFCKTAGGGFLFNGGSRNYNFIGVDPVDELMEMILKSPDTKTEFHALDFGAGKFGWAKGTAEKLQDKLPAGKSLHIYSLTGENCGYDKIHMERIHLYNLGGIPLERLDLKHVQDNLFKKIGGHKAKFDMIVSQYTYLHLVDPLGTFVTSYNSLTQGGMIMFDQFPIFGKGDISEDSLDINQTLALNAIKEPYIMGERVAGSPRQYILKRTLDTPLQLSFAYDTTNINEQWVRHAADKPRAHYIFPKNDAPFLFGRTYDLSMKFFDMHTTLKGNNHKLFDELYARNRYWKNQKVEWQSYWVDEKHPDEIREPQNHN